jgi:hypothetical protein
VTAPTIAIAALEAVSVRRRKMRRGSSGERERSSMRTKVAISAAAPPKRASVPGALQPSVAARVVA